MQLHVLARLVANAQEMVNDFILPDALIADQKQMFSQDEILRDTVQLLQLSGVLEEQCAFDRE